MKKDTRIKNVMEKAILKAKTTMNDNIGGPFGAAIIDQDGKIVSVTSNSVLKDHDPTAHAEMNAIRAAGEKLGTHDLTGCTLVTTAYPCPMCLAATIWANIKHVVYGCRPTDADKIGFRDEFIYRFMREDNPDKQILTLDEKHRDECLLLFKEYKEKNKELY
ncbi:nucleoside deaminase [Mariniplasma anaerobium]|uniref:tRNA-specific adenosine deaminase n=1 Tax=Mariniplasma anaerobium TaxID=2735436 RepID=A0A7U9XWS8_9MOLU|nr:nucleoside deaminase [Mariniplasma anaerobium]BCR36714.1 tRNA-specific adenosine deaminase [Mariniplasma anaerobium]